LTVALLLGIGVLRYGNRLPAEVPYRSEIEAVSRKYGLEPELVTAVVRQESRFQPNAVSRVGAQGLMQLMPETADDIARRRGMDPPGERIFEPVLNLDFGCWYLHDLLAYFDGEVATAVAAYNAGPSITRKWLEDPTCSSDGRTLDTIPYAETANYVRRVMRYREDYKRK